MQLTGLFLGLGQEAFAQLLRGISMGKLRTYQLLDRVKTRAHLGKLNQENLRKSAPRLWSRLDAQEEELAADLAQAILVSNLDMIIAVLDFLGVPHNDGFFEKDAQLTSKLGEGWQQKAWDQFNGKFTQPVLLFYLNHLTREVDENAPLFLPAGGSP